jgi:hypothetical protein
MHCSEGVVVACINTVVLAEYLFNHRSSHLLSGHKRERENLSIAVRERKEKGPI